MTNDKPIGEIEVSFNRVRPEAYEVELRINDPNPANQGMNTPVRGQAVIPLSELKDLQSQPEPYGRLLSEAVFANQKILLQCTRYQAIFASGFRLRILIAESAPELHDVRWELLRDPLSGITLGTSERILFSRFPTSQDCRSINLRPKAKLKAVVAVSAPSNLDDFELAPVNAEQQILLATTALAGIEVEIVEQPLTLARLTKAIRGCDILYLVCHGSMPPGLEPQLFLANEQGKVDIIPAGKLTSRIADLIEPPRLIVLASCESAGPDADSTAQAQTALAPRLAEVGVPAILAMHGRISMKTIELAIPEFLRELLVDGQIDRALACARGVVRDRFDHWMPALFLRLKNGRIWYEPGFTGSNSEMETWPAICRQVVDGEFIPILGPGVSDELFGGYRKVAAQLADEYRFPGAPHEKSDLPKVAQFLTVKQGRAFTEKAVRLQVAANIAGLKTNEDLNDLLDLHVENLVAKPDDPHTILAGLNARIYISATPDTTMFRVLKKTGKAPEPLTCAWRTLPGNTPQQPVPTRVLEPDRDNPWVYHVFGIFPPEGDDCEDGGSLVLTEDDFFDYLIATSRSDLIPEGISGELMKNSLMLLGFRLDDWTFRILFRMIMAMGGTANMLRYKHVGVQVDPDSSSFADAARAREYLSAYFASTGVIGRSEPSINIYWGSSTDFLKELKQRVSSFDAPAAQTVKKVRKSGFD